MTHPNAWPEASDLIEQSILKNNGGDERVKNDFQLSTRIIPVSLAFILQFEPVKENQVGHLLDLQESLYWPPTHL